MLYKPRKDDYVKWKHLEGWVYFVCPDYITIEVGVKEKCKEQFIGGTFHKKNYFLVFCYSICLKDLTYIKTRVNE